VKVVIKQRAEMIRKGVVPEGYKQTKVGIIPQEWEEKELGDIAKITMGQSPTSTSYNNKGIGYPLIQGNNDILNRKSLKNVYTSAPTKICKAGDILLTVRAPVGEVAIAKFDSCIGRGVCAISTKKSNKFLLQQLINLEEKWEKLSQGSTFKAINGKDIRSLLVAYPPLPEQTAIANVLSTADKEIDLLNQKLETLKQQKKALMQLLLTGIVRTTGLNLSSDAEEEGVAYVQ
jgi:type I restriction enzyme S subunit